MYAIVNCCDRYHIFAYHTILTYDKLWPNNPFIFRIPWNETKPKYIQEHFGDKVELIKTKKSFKETVFTLIEDLDENCWVYWCSSDTYIEKINLDIAITAYNYIKSINDSNIFGLSFCRTKGINIDYKKKPVNFDGKEIYFKTKAINHQHMQFWIHQFMRTKILRYIFESFDEPKKLAKELDYQLYNNNNPLYLKIQLGEFLTFKEGSVVFGENTSRSKITLNCIDNFKKYNLKKPDYINIININLFWGKI
jgi:hypothetical protein